jgi:hypothetical protein
MKKILKSVTPAIALLLLGTATHAAEILTDAMFLDDEHPHIVEQTLAPISKYKIILEVYLERHFSDIGILIYL